MRPQSLPICDRSFVACSRSQMLHAPVLQYEVVNLVTLVDHIDKDSCWSELVNE